MLVLQQDDPNLCMLLIIVDLDARCLRSYKNFTRPLKKLKLTLFTLGP
ncbi:hypothetical protein Hdeb2414_s0005g00183871 [Helianthus debilis subsp. tardiflorus]